MGRFYKPLTHPLKHSDRPSALLRGPLAMAPALLTAIDSTSHIHLIVGSNPLAGQRCSKALEVGATPIIIAPETSNVHYGLAKRIEDHSVQWIKRDFQDSDLVTLGRDETDNVVDAVFVTSGGRSTLATHISTSCRRLRIPINVADAPSLCTFTLLSTHTSGPLQIGVTTSGKGCKLASRIRREIAAALPSDLGIAVERLGTVRRRIWEQDHATEAATELEAEDDDAGQSATFNKLVTPTDAEAARARRMRWLAQICEYWPLRRLAAISDDDVDGILQAYKHDSSIAPSSDAKPLLNPAVLDARRNRGRIILAGSGPGHPDLLTTLEYVNTAVEEEGSRPPGLLVVGAVCDVLEKKPQKWVVEDGFQGLDVLEDMSDGGRGLDALRERLVTPGLEESGDPLSNAADIAKAAVAV